MDAFDRQILSEIDAEERKCLLEARRAGRSIYRVKSQWDKVRKDMSGVYTGLYKRRSGVNADLLGAQTLRRDTSRRTRIVKPLTRSSKGFLRAASWECFPVSRWRTHRGACSNWPRCAYPRSSLLLHKVGGLFGCRQHLREGRPSRGGDSTRTVEDFVVAQSLELGLPGACCDGVRIASEEADDLLHLAGTQIFTLRAAAKQHDRAVQRDARRRYERRHARRVLRLCHGNNLRWDRPGFKRRRAKIKTTWPRGSTARGPRRSHLLQSNSWRSRLGPPSYAFLDLNQLHHRVLGTTNLSS